MLDQIINDHVIELPELQSLLNPHSLQKLYDNYRQMPVDEHSELVTSWSPQDRESTDTLDAGARVWDLDWDGKEYIRVHPSETETLSKENKQFIQTIFNCFNHDVMFDQLEGWMINKKETVWMRPHIDRQRNCVLIVPIFPENYNIAWCEREDTGQSRPSQSQIEQQLKEQKWGKILYEHTYRMPTIINGKIPHTVFDYNQTARRHFQLSLFFNSSDWDKTADQGANFWSELVECYREGNLIKTSH